MKIRTVFLILCLSSLFKVIGQVNLGADTSVCNVDSLILNASSPGAISYTWQDMSNDSTFTATSTGVYYVTVDFGGSTQTDTIQVQFVSFDLGNDTTLYFGQHLTIDLSALPGMIDWQGLSSNIVQIVDSGQYSAELTANYSVCLDTLNVSLVQVPDSNILGNDTFICPGESLILNTNLSNNDYDFLWQDMTTDSFLVAAAQGLYSVEVSIANTSCMVEDSIQVDFLVSPIFDLGADTTLCAGDSLLLSTMLSDTSHTFVWQDNSTGSSFQASSSGLYYVTVSNGICSFSDSINVTFATLPLVDLGNDAILCTGESLILNTNLSNNDYDFLWQDLSTDSFLVASAQGMYSVEVSIGNSSCAVVDSIQIDFLVSPIFDLGADTTLCAGDSLLLSTMLSDTSHTFVWQDNSMGSSFQASSSGLYYVEANNGTCSFSDSINVTFATLPVVDLGNDTTLCSGDTIVLDASNAGANFLWSPNNEITQTIEVFDAGIYRVEVNNAGCIGSDTLVVTETTLNFNLGPDTSICAGEVLNLDVSMPGAAYTWQDGSQNPEFQVDSSGTYWVEVNAGNCAASDTIEVVYFDISNFVNPNIQHCQGEQVLVDYSNIPGNPTFLWSDSSTNASNTLGQNVNVDWVQIIHPCGVETVNFQLSEYPELIFELGNDTFFCNIGQPGFSFSQPGFVFYTWNGVNSNGLEVLSESETYIAEATDTFGCFYSDTILIDLIECEDLLVPTAFSPNGDGINDFFKPIFLSELSNYADYELIVYNRWANPIFITSDYLIGWDGTYKSKLVDVGVFIWVVSYKLQGIPKIKKGNVSLIR